MFSPRQCLQSIGSKQWDAFLRKPRLWCRATAAGTLLVACLSGATAASAQITEYEDYPKTRGQIERFQTLVMPAWLRLDGELRGRVEGQTALGSAFQQAAGDGLSRIRVGAAS